MSWFRDKKKVVDPDKVYDLDDVVWRGVEQMQRLDRLADEADRAAALNQDQPGQGPHFTPKQPASLIDEVIATAAPEDWAAPNPLPVKPERPPVLKVMKFLILLRRPHLRLHLFIIKNPPKRHWKCWQKMTLPDPSQIRSVWI